MSEVCRYSNGVNRRKLVTDLVIFGCWVRIIIKDFFFLVDFFGVFMLYDVIGV